MLKKSILSIAVVLVFATAVNAKEVSKDNSINDNQVSNDNFSCGKISGKSLSEFKEDLLEHCDLSKPFSTSLTRLLNDDTYLYCCHKKK